MVGFGEKKGKWGKGEISGEIFRGALTTRPMTSSTIFLPRCRTNASSRQKTSPASLLDHVTHASQKTLLTFHHLAIIHFLSPNSRIPQTQPYTRQANHTPNTGSPETEIYVLALQTDSAHRQCLTDIRKRYFPPHVSQLDAHICLFRALPGSQLTTIQDDIHQLVQYYRPFTIRTTQIYATAHGVAVNVHAPLAGDIYERLRDRWAPFLSKQDQLFNAHYMIQNKVDRKVAQQTLNEVLDSFSGSEGVVLGVTLWRYMRGRWEDGRMFLFPED